MENNSIQNWGEKINWSKRVNSICKPCWELKYCPYGPLVEDFPISENRTEKSCRIFGHDCPVFYCNEPLTETKDLRRINRTIPRDIQFKVLKRDNQICQICKKNVLEDDINFDHIIPLSKGGPTEVHNIRLLCSNCNKKKSNNFENEYLVNNFVDHVSQPVGIIIINALLEIADFYCNYKKSKKNEPTFDDLILNLDLNDENDLSSIYWSALENFKSIFKKSKNSDFNYYDILKHRWGFKDMKIHNIKEIKKEYNIDYELLFKDEIKLLNIIGWKVLNNKENYNNWLKY